MTELNQTTLDRLDPAIAVPGYERATVTPGIVHLGVGGFHRSHEAAYIDTLLARGHTEWGIHGVGLQPSNVGMRDALAAQDTLYTLVLRHTDGTWDPRVIGSIIDYTLAPADPGAVLDALTDPRTRIVSLTVTEGGYSIDPITGRFDPTTPAVAADLSRAGGAPSTMFGFVIEALARRRAAGHGPFTIVSCDNIQGNGHVAHDTFTSFARLRDPELAAWIADEVRFPNCMVDRITPQTTDADRTELARRFGVEDRWPVVCEPFTQWVLEDNFSAGRPPLDEVGVQLVSDVEPYELMKLRLLNASHQAMAYPGYLVGYRVVNDVAADPLFAGYLLDYMTHEAIPTLRPVPGIDLTSYSHELIERFSNPEVGDTVARLCANTSDLIPKFLVPVLRANLSADRPIVRSTAVIAFWARYAQGVDEAGQPYPIDDILEPQLRAAAARQADTPTAFLDDNRNLFGDLVDNPRFTGLYLRLLESVRVRGVRATLTDLDQFEP